MLSRVGRGRRASGPAQLMIAVSCRNGYANEFDAPRAGVYKGFRKHLGR